MQTRPEFFRECIETEGLHTRAVIVSDGAGGGDDVPIDRESDNRPGARGGTGLAKLSLEHNDNAALAMDGEGDRHLGHVFKIRKRRRAGDIGRSYLHTVELPDATVT